VLVALLNGASGRAPSRSAISGVWSITSNTRPAAATPCCTLLFTSESVLIGEMVASSATMNITNVCASSVCVTKISRPPSHSMMTATSTTAYSLTGAAAADTRRRWTNERK